MHTAIHAAIGGDMGSGLTGPNDPSFWFHHGMDDMIRRVWQHRNAHLRPVAYGYPAVSSYTVTPVRLHDYNPSCPALRPLSPPSAPPR